MTDIAFKTTFPLAGLVSGLPLDALATVHSTKDALGAYLGSVSMLRNKPAKLAYDLELNQATAAGEAIVRVVAAGQTLAAVTLNLSAGTEFSGRFDVDLSTVQGQTPIKVEMEVTTAAAAATTADLKAQLDVEFPFASMGC